MSSDKIPSGVEIDYDGTDITRHVLYAQTNFTAQANAIPGDGTVVCRDPQRTLDFHSLRPLRLYLDGQPMWGGVIGRVGRGNFFSAVRTDDLSQVRTRRWTLTGPDNNVYFDRRVLRKPGDYLTPMTTASGTISEVIHENLHKFIDFPPGMSLDGVDATGPYHNVSMPPDLSHATWVGQSKYWREQMDDFGIQAGILYYLDADMVLQVHDFENVRSPWGFTDSHPDGHRWIGFREGEYDEDSLAIITEALVWGGSALHVPGTAVEGSTAVGTIFARFPSDTAHDQTWDGITYPAAAEQKAINRRDGQYGRWEASENFVGQQGYLLQSSVSSRAIRIIEGMPGSHTMTGGDVVEEGQNRPAEDITLTWFAHDVPRPGGVPTHLRAGHLADFIFYTLGPDAAHPVNLILPTRQLRITFPTLPGQNDAREMLTYVRFDGTFGISLNDPRWLWRYLLGAKKRPPPAINGRTSNGSGDAAAGDRGTFYPIESTNGVRTDFTVPFGYYPGTTRVYLNGLLQRIDMDYIEQSPGTGVVRFAAPPYADDSIFIECLVAV